MKKIIRLSILSLILFTLVACSGNTGDTDNTDISAENKEKVLFEHSNLNDEDSLGYVISLLENAGVSKERTEVFKDSVAFFNGCIDASLLTKSFEEADMTQEFYDPYSLQDMWMEKNPDFNGYNCRITAFSLFDDFLDVSEEAEIRDNDLFMDKESLDTNSSAFLRDDDSWRFCALFSVVPTDNTKDINVHLRKITEDFRKRGITFKENDKMSLITMWQHNQWSEDENELFVGHTGVLLKDGDGYVFLEKIAFQEPYQAVKFDSKNQLNDYLMKKYNTSWDQPTAEPFVMENDHLISK